MKPLPSVGGLRVKNLAINNLSRESVCTQRSRGGLISFRGRMELELKNHITSSISESESVSSEEQAGASLAEVADSLAKTPKTAL